MTFAKAQQAYDTQSPPESSHLPCANCGERAEDHERRTVGLTEYVFCEEAASDFDGFLEDTSIQFQEQDEDDARDDARLKAAGL